MSVYGPGGSNPSGFDDQGRWFEAARSAVQGPGIALQWFGLISLGLTILTVGVILVAPDVALRRVWEEELKANRERAPEDRRRVPSYPEFAQAATTQTLIFGLVQMAISLAIFYGGTQMKALRGYRWGVAAGALAILPVNAFCCFSAALGAWALVALFGSDVRLAFARNRGVTPLA